MFPKSGRTGAGRRRHVTFATMLVAAFVVPAAIAWACNPQEQISLDKTSYQPGSAITIHGSYFPTSQSVTVSGPSGSATVMTSSGGGFTTSLPAPTSPGNYTINASKATGGFAPASFRVVAPVATAPTPSQQGAAPTNAAPAPQQQAARPNPQFNTPNVARSDAPASAERRATAPARSSGTATAPRASTGSAGTVTSATGQQVFSGSTAQAAPVQTFATAPAPAARSSRSSSASRPAPATSSAPAEQAALSDLFSNYEPGRTPSLTGSAAGEPAGGAGSGLGLGIGLLAFGLFSLVAGLTAAEVRRRRVA